MGELLDAAKVMVQPTIKLLDMIQSGVGTLYNPINMKRTADAKVYEIEKIGQALRENSDIPIGYSNGAITMDTQDFREFVERTQSRLAYQEMTKQANIEKVSVKAYQLLEGEEDVEDNPVEQDWTMRFFNCVEDVSNEKMQEIWSKILAGEVKKTGSFSMRTLETLKNISQKEAEMFKKLMPFLLNYNGVIFLLNDDEINRKYKVYYGEILILEDCGLISSNGSVTIKITVSGDNGANIYNNNCLLKISKTSEKEEKISVGIYKLTQAGKELFEILNSDSNDNYFMDFVDKLFNKNKNKINASVHKVVNVDMKGVEYESDPIKKFSVSEIVEK